VTVLRGGSASDVGRVRTVNQDSVFVSATLFAVADGMGGHAGGEVASAAAISILERSQGSVGTKEGFVEALVMANEEILEMSSSDASLAGMGTTMVAASLIGTEENDVLVLANVGDSRGYHFHGGRLDQITKDHSLAAELLREGSITEAEAAHHPQRHVITRALGIPGEVNVDLFDVELSLGDRVLLCSDGLSNEVDSEEIIRVLSTITDPHEAAEDLVRRANANGGADNISVVIIDALVARERDDEPTRAHVAVIAEPAAKPSLDPEPADPEKPEKVGWFARRKKMGVPRLLTFRVIGFFLLVVGVIAAGWYFVNWYATSSYYVTSSGTQIVIYQGRPGGVLWIQPKLVEVTPTSTTQILPIRQPALKTGVNEPSLSAAKNYVSNLANEYSQSVTTPNASSSTTIPSSMPRISIHHLVS
jgi:protein phosphatase